MENTPNQYLFYCPIHPKKNLIEICTKLDCSSLFCELCLSENNQHDHKGWVITLEKFFELCSKKFKMKIDQEKSEKKELEEDLKLNLFEMDQFWKKYTTHLASEKQRIEVDFTSILAKIDELKDVITSLKLTLISKLEEDYCDITITLENLHSHEFPADLTSNLTDLYEKLILLKSDSQKNIENSNQILLNLVDSYSKLASQTEFDIVIERSSESEEKKMESDQETSISVLRKLIEDSERIKEEMMYPPKYKVNQNSSNSLTQFMKNLEDLYSKTFDFSEILILSRNQNEMLFKGVSTKKFIMGHSNSSLAKTFEDNTQPNELILVTTIQTSHKKGINCISMFGDDYFVTGANDFVIRFWDLSTFRFVKGFKCERIPYSLISLEDENDQYMLVSGHQEGYLLVVSAKLEIKHVFKEQLSLISSLIYLQDGRTVIAGSYDSTVFFYDVRNYNVIKKITDHLESINCLTTSHDCKMMASGGDDTSIRLWSLDFTFNESDVVFQDASHLRTIDNGHTVKTMKFLINQSNLLLSNCYNIVKLWDCENGSCLRRICKHDHYIYKIVTIETKKQLYKKAFSTLNLPQSRPMPSLFNLGFNEIDREASHIDLTNYENIDPFFIVTSGQDHKIKLWDVFGEAPIAEIHDSFKEFAVEDPFVGLMLIVNEKDNCTHFLASSDRASFINLWKINEK